MTAREEELETAISIMKYYLSVRLNAEDWHGVRDAAADIEVLLGRLAELRRSS